MREAAQGSIPPADLLPVQRKATPVFRLLHLLAEPLLRLVFRYRLEGRANIPRDRPYVIIANHLNWLDPFMLLTVFPTEPRVHFLANPENLVRHRVHWALVKAVAGYIPVNLRQPRPELFKHVDRCLQAGGVVAIFPEAAYGAREGELQDSWKSGFAHFAVDNGTPVLPVALSGTKDLWLRKQIRVVVGEPVETEGRTVDEVVALGRERLAAILPDYSEPAGRKMLRKWLTGLLY